MSRAVDVLCALALGAGLGLATPAVALRPHQSATAAPLREGRALIARARAAGRWTAAERAELRGILPRLASDERGEVLRSLAMAMNRGEVVLDGISRPN